MLFRSHILRGISEGRVTLAFRRWRRAAPAPDSTLRTPIGVIHLDRVAVVDEGDITADDIRRTGMTVEELRRSIAGEGTLLRIELRVAGDDPRIALRENVPDSKELEAVAERLAQMDDRRAGPFGPASVKSNAPWTTSYLQLIDAQPGVVSHVLAAQAGSETLSFKRRVRRLKELGLTESLEVGYRLSPRGRALLAHLLARSR
jgi:hypothetical protein